MQGHVVDLLYDEAMRQYYRSPSPIDSDCEEVEDDERLVDFNEVFQLILTLESARVAQFSTTCN